MQVNELKSENGKPITAFVTNSITAYAAERDNNMVKLAEYIYSIEPVKYHDDQLVIKTGKEQADKELGRRFKINNVENAQKDNNGLPLNSYVHQVKHDEDDKLTFITGEQHVQNSNGVTYTINNVEKAFSAVNDELGNRIINSYAKKEHEHEVLHIKGIKEFIQATVVDVINKALDEGKIQVQANTINLCQHERYDFVNENETITIPLKKNTLYNRPAPVVLRMQDENTSMTNFTYSFDINAYDYNKKYIDSRGKLIHLKKLSFGSPRKLADGYVSYSGVITLDDLTYINYVNVNTNANPEVNTNS